MGQEEPQTRVRAYESDKERINDLRQGDDTQADVIARLLSDPGPSGDSPPETESWSKEEVQDFEEQFEGLGPIDADSVEFEPFIDFEEIQAQLDRIEEVATGTGSEGDVDDTELAREVARQVDYAALANKVADELEGRMR